MTLGLQFGGEIYPEIVLAERKPGESQTILPGSWRVRRTTINALLKSRRLAPITIVGASDDRERSAGMGFPDALARRFDLASRSNFLILAYPFPGKAGMEAKIGLLRAFSSPERVEISEDPGTISLMVENIAAKIGALRERRDWGAAARPGPLDSTKAMIAGSADLRVPNGNLSAREIAKVFGLSGAALAGILGRSRQSLDKAPAADSLQEALGFFERIARLRTVLARGSDFQKWLRMPRPDLGGNPPIDWVRQGRWQALADLVDDMLTGAPA